MPGEGYCNKAVNARGEIKPLAATPAGPELIYPLTMDPRARISVYPLDVYVLTERGQEELKRGSTALTPTELSLLVLMDGKANVREIAQRSAGLTEQEIAMLLPKLIQGELVTTAPISAEVEIDFSYFFNADKSVPEPSAEAKELAKKEAETGTPALERDGYYVSIARRALQARRPASGTKLSVLAVEDDPQLSGLLRNMLRLEGFEPRTATNREEVLNALRQAPSPDLVLLDVRLPDANGFDILMRMKQHPLLKAIPVIMLTGEATRESVMRGLAGGADGYVTKPFEVAMLLTGIRSVLGIA